MDEEACGRGKVDLCAFCRSLGSTSDEDEVKRMKKLMVAENAHAFYNLAGWHATGDLCRKTLQMPMNYISERGSLDVPRHIAT